MITAPLEFESRAQWVDWLEVFALKSGRWVGEVDVESAVGIGSNEDRDHVDSEGVRLDGEILDPSINKLLDDIASEVQFRESSLGPDYPFESKVSPFSIRYRSVDAEDLIHDIYIFNLLMSAVTQDIIRKTDLGAASHDLGRKLFHACASLGVAGLLEEPSTYWFGFPRPDKSSFSTALADLSKKLGFPIPKVPPPAGLPAAAKDDQVDIVGWRKYGDRTVGTLVILCQASTGNNWRGKSIRTHLEAFMDWFERSPYGLAWPSLAYPFMAHHELVCSDEEDYELALFNYLKRLNQNYGTLLDRLRIVQGARAVLSRGAAYAAQEVAGWDKVPDVQAWKNSAVLALRAA